MQRRGTPEGFTLAELLVALVILSVGILGVQLATTRYLNTVTTSDRRAEALQLARDRLDQIRTDPAYDRLVQRYHNVVETEILPGLTRRTLVVRDTTRTGKDHLIDFTRVTVVVEGTGLTQPIKRSQSVGRP